jgi:hypothetical protein
VELKPDHLQLAFTKHGARINRARRLRRKGWQELAALKREVLLTVSRLSALASSLPFHRFHGLFLGQIDVWGSENLVADWVPPR